MPDIFFPTRFKFMSQPEAGLFQVYSTHILSKSFGNMPGIYLDYSSACESASRSNAIGMQLLSQYTYFGCQGCLISSANRGRHRDAWQRQSVSRCSPMWPSIDCDVAAAANPRKISWSRWCTHKTCTMHSQEGKQIHKQIRISGLYLQDHQIKID